MVISLLYKVLCDISRDPFQNMKGGFSESVQLRNFAASFFSLLIVLGTMGIVTTIVIAFFQLGIGGSRAREGAKETIVLKLVLAGALSAVVALVGIVYTVAKRYA